MPEKASVAIERYIPGEPLEEPEDPYGLNEHGPCDFAVSAGVIPLVGLASATAAFSFYLEQKPDNPFNLAEQARLSGWLVLYIQALWLVLGLGVLLLL